MDDEKKFPNQTKKWVIRVFKLSLLPFTILIEELHQIQICKICTDL